MDKTDLKVKHFRKIYDNFISTSAPLKVYTTSLTVHRMRRRIDFAIVTGLASALLTAQMKVYPQLFTNLTTDLGFMCNLFVNHFTELQSGHPTCIDGV